MEDPLFDPWRLAAEDEAPTPRPGTSRWRLRDTVGRTLSVTPPRLATLSTPGHRAGIVGTPGFIRTMAIPRLQRIGQLLSLARHFVLLEDRLDDSSPLVLLTLRPWRGPLSDSEPTEGVLTIEVILGEEERIGVAWQVTGADTSREVIPTMKFDAAWLERRVTTFISQVLGAP